MSPAGDVQKAKIRLAAMGSLARPVLMRWAWIFFRSFIEVHCLSSKENNGWSEMNLDMEVGDGICDQHEETAIFVLILWFLFSLYVILCGRIKLLTIATLTHKEAELT